jgi:hypothetical protein
MELFEKLETDLNNFVQQNLNIINSYTNFTTIDDVNKCKTSLAQLQEYSNIMNKLNVLFQNKTNECIDNYDKKVKIMRSMLLPMKGGKIQEIQVADEPPQLKPQIVKEEKEQKKNDDEAWSIVAPHNKIKNYGFVPHEISNVILATEENINQKLFIKAIPVKSVNDIPAIPIYYIIPSGEYAIRFLDNKIIRGGCGNVFQSPQVPFSVVCTYGANCKRVNCQFYHDPEEVKNSKNIMNWSSYNDIKYNSGKEENMKSYGWKVGSLNKLEYDIKYRLTSQEAYRFSRFAMHNLLVALSILYNSDLIK